MMASDLPAKKLPIYDNGKVKKDSATGKSNGSTSSHNKSFGVSAMMLLSDVKEKYRNTVRAVNNFHRYANSTEGKVKFSVMLIGLAGGCVLAYRSPSKRLWYRRLIPVGTLTVATAICYPFAAWKATVAISHGVFATYKISKVIVVYTYGKFKTLQGKYAESTPKKKEEQQEKSYILDDKGMPVVTPQIDQSEDDAIKSKSEVVHISKKAEVNSKMSSVDKSMNNKINLQRNTIGLASDTKITPIDISTAARVKDDSEIPLIIPGQTVKFFTTPAEGPTIATRPSQPDKKTSKERSFDRANEIYKFTALPKSAEKKLDQYYANRDIGQGVSDDADLYTTRSNQ